MMAKSLSDIKGPPVAQRAKSLSDRKRPPVAQRACSLIWFETLSAHRHRPSLGSELSD